MSLLRTKGLQIGQDGTATNNFTLYQPGVPDGTLRIGNGNNGSVTDAITLNSSGKVGIGTSSPSSNLHVQTTGANASITIQETSSAQYAQYLRLQDSTTSWYVVNRYANTGSTSSGFGIGTTSSGDYLQIDTSGRVTMPSQPSFKAYVDGGGQINSNNVALVFSDVTNRRGHNIGNHYNPSTGVFTAPISGRYLFSAAMLTNPANMANGAVNIQWRINGSDVHYLAHNHNASWVMESAAVIFNLSANDTVNLYMYTGSGHYGSYSHFSGCLLG